MGIRSGFQDFSNGLALLFRKPKEGEGDRKLAKVSMVVEGMINSQTKPEIRRRVINDVEKTLRKEAKKGGKEAVEQKIAITLATPEYKRLLHRLGLEEPDVRVIAMQVLKEG